VVQAQWLSQWTDCKVVWASCTCWHTGTKNIHFPCINCSMTNFLLYWQANWLCKCLRLAFTRCSLQNLARASGHNCILLCPVHFSTHSSSCPSMLHTLGY
jgi:hypothetical protein